MRYLSFALAAAILIGAALAWALVPVHYEAFALLRVSSHPPAIMDASSAAAAEEFGIFKRTQAGLIRSHRVLRGALQHRDISQLPTVLEHPDDSAAWLSAQLSIDFPDDAEILRLAMSGPRKDDVVRIVDQVVDTYLREVVQYEREQRLEQEARLERTYGNLAAELRKEQDALQKLEALHKSNGSESAVLKKEIAHGELERYMNQRARLEERIRETELQIELMKARPLRTKDVRTADLGPEGKLPDAEDFTLPVLEKQKELLEEQLKTVEESIEKQVEIVDSMNTYSAAIIAKQEEVRSAQKIVNDLRTTLDRIKVERMAPERITKLDDAVVVNASGDAVLRNTGLLAAAIASLGLVALGISTRPRGRQS